MSYFEEAYDSVRPHRAAMVYNYLRDRAGKNGDCWPGMNTIATDLKFSRSTVKRALADLQVAGRVTMEAAVPGCFTSQNKNINGRDSVRPDVDHPRLL